MYEVEIVNKNSKVIIKFTGALTIQNSIAIREVLFKALIKNKSFCINHDKVEEYDISYFQLLISLGKSAIQSGKSLIIEDKNSDSFNNCYKESGLPMYSWIFRGHEFESFGVIENE